MSYIIKKEINNFFFNTKIINKGFIFNKKKIIFNKLQNCTNSIELNFITYKQINQIFDLLKNLKTINNSIFLSYFLINNNTFLKKSLIFFYKTNFKILKKKIDIDDYLKTDDDILLEDDEPKNSSELELNFKKSYKIVKINYIYLKHLKIIDSINNTKIKNYKCNNIMLYKNSIYSNKIYQFLNNIVLLHL